MQITKRKSKIKVLKRNKGIIVTFVNRIKTSAEIIIKNVGIFYNYGLFFKFM